MGNEMPHDHMMPHDHRKIFWNVTYYLVIFNNSYGEIIVWIAMLFIQVQLFYYWCPYFFINMVASVSFMVNFTCLASCLHLINLPELINAGFV